MRFTLKTKRFEPALGGESALYAEPSPDGQWMAWVRYPEGTLWKSRPDGSGRVQLTTPPGVAHLPRWSPDGKRLVFASWPDASRRDAEIRVVAADGSEADLLVRPPGLGEGFWDPCWLTDGSIVFSRMRLPNPQGLLRFDPRTRRVAPLPATGRFSYPKCSRDGDILAWSFREPGQTRWMLLRRGSSTWIDLGDFNASYPSWTRDGRSVCALSRPGMRVECLSLDTRRMTLLAEPGPLELVTWVVVPWMGLDAENNPLVTVGPGRAETLYALDWEQP